MPGLPSAAAFREVVDAALFALDADERSGPLVRATGMRMRFELPDVGLGARHCRRRTGPPHNFRWAFADGAGWEPRLRFKMNSDVANRFFQGTESLAIAIARGRVHVQGEARYTMLYIPALRLLVEPYRRAVHDHCPELAL